MAPFWVRQQADHRAELQAARSLGSEQMSPRYTQRQTGGLAVVAHGRAHREETLDRRYEEMMQETFTAK